MFGDANLLAKKDLRRFWGVFTCKKITLDILCHIYDR